MTAPGQLTYDGLDHAAVQMLIDHVDGSGVRAHFECAPGGRTFLYVDVPPGETDAAGSRVMLWPGCQVSLGEDNVVHVS